MTTVRTTTPAIMEEKNQSNGGEQEEPRSVKRGKMKEAAVEASPSAGRGVGVPTNGFGAVLDKVPPPISTDQKYEVPNIQIVQPGPRTLPPINEQISRQSIADARATLGLGVLSQPELSGPGNLVNVDPFDNNPYLDKADQIGAGHGFGPVILGNLLVPPGWNEGDPPLSAIEAREVFNVDRAKAADRLRRDLEETAHAESEERDKAWLRDYNLDKYILKQRVEIYNEYLERQREKAYTKSARFVQTDVLRLPLGPPTLSNPGLLDPVLIFSTFQAAREQYASNKVKISLWDHANERHMATEINKCERALQRHPVSQQSHTQILESSNGAHEAPPFAVPNPPGYQLPIPQSNESFQGPNSYRRPSMAPPSEFSMPQFHSQQGPRNRTSLSVLGQPSLQTRSGAQEQQGHRDSFKTPGDQSPDCQIIAEYPSPSLMGYNRGYPGFNSRNQPTPAHSKVEPSKKAIPAKKTRGPASLKIVPKPLPSPSEPWYQREVEEANLPTHMPSVEFINETLADRRSGKKAATAKEPKAKKASPKKRRRDRSPLDLVKGIPLNAAQADALVKAGAQWVDASTQLPGEASRGKASAAGPQVSQTTTTARNPQVNHKTTKSGSTAASGTTTSSVESLSRTPSEPSSFEDPEDNTFTPSGKRKAAGPSSASKKRAWTVGKGL